MLLFNYPKRRKIMSKQAQENINQIKKEVWQTLREVSKSQQETRQIMQETSRKMQETDRQMQETDRRMKEMSKELTASRKESNKRIKKLDELFTSQWGKLMEALVEGDLLKLLKQQNIRVDDTTMNMKGNHKGEEDWEIDILASNGEEIVLVEVKTTLKLNYVKEFMEKLRKFTSWKPIYKGKKVYGAVAYLKSHQGSAKYAEKKGLFVIRATGSSASIVNKKDFKPKTFF